MFLSHPYRLNSPGRHRKKNITFNADEHGNQLVVGSLQRELDEIVEKYRFMHKAPRVMDLEKIQKTVRTKYRKHAFPLPPQLVHPLDLSSPLSYRYIYHCHLI